MNSIVLAAVVSVGLCSLARADWDFSTPAGNQGFSHTYLSGVIPIKAYGFYSTLSGSGTSTQLNFGNQDNLFGKQGGANETGLGLADEVNTEIDKLHAIELDFSNSAFNNKVVTLTLQSIQTGPQESYDVFSSSSFKTTGGMMSLIPPPSPGQTSGSFVFSGAGVGGSNAFIAISGSAYNVLISTAAISNGVGTVPEPRFYGLLLVAMLGFAGIVLKNRRRVAEIE